MVSKGLLGRAAHEVSDRSSDFDVTIDRANY